MIIKSVVISNFGKHAALEFQCHAHVVGLLGPNGVGKSTVLDAIEFAITGELRDPIPSYVRHGEGNASVAMTFIKNGMEGYIFRQFGKTSKRKLVWDGREIKAAKEVDQTMAAIFGADKQAIANAVFINQGMLENILFSGDTDRRQLFIKLVNMAFCEHRSHVIEGKIRKIQDTIVDLGPALDAAAEQTRQADEVLQATKQIYDAMPDYAAAWSYCDQFVRTEDQLRQVLTLIGQVESEARTGEERLHEMLESWGKADHAEAKTYMMTLESMAKQEQEDFSKWKSIKAELIHYQRTTREINDKMKQLREEMSKKEHLNPNKLTIEQIDALLKDSTRVLDEQNAREVAVKELAHANTELWTAETQLTNRRQPRESWEQISVRNDRITKMSVTCDTLAGFLAKQQEFAQCGAEKRVIPAGSILSETTKQTIPTGAVQCMQCGLIIANPEALSPESLTQTRRTLEELDQQIAQDKNTYKELKADWETCDREAKQLTSNRDYWATEKTNLEVMIARVPKVDFTAMLVEHEKMLVIKAQMPALDKAITMLNGDIGGLMKTRLTYTLAAANLDRVEAYTDAKEQEFAQAISETEAMCKTKRNTFDEMTRVKTTLEALDKQLQQHLTAKKNHEQVLEQPMPATVSELSCTLGGNLVATRAELQARQDARNAAGGRLEQAEANLRETQASYQSLVNRAKADEEKRKLIEDLGVLRDLLKSEGLPLSVVRYHFEHLARLTQEALNQLDANFSIQIDQETPLSFKFVRLDEPEHEPLPMTKLSGGQRVRLCTAFLIAVQQRLVREVGLLVLDEPSTHIDQTGVESLAELLSTLGHQLGNTETQIIVSDHHPMLRTCFSKVLELS